MSLMARSRRAPLMLKPKNVSLTNSSRNSLSLSSSSTSVSSYNSSFKCYHNSLRRRPRELSLSHHQYVLQEEVRIQMRELQQKRNFVVGRSGSGSDKGFEVESFTEWIWRQVKVPKGFENFFPKGAGKPKNSKSGTSKGSTSTPKEAK